MMHMDHTFLSYPLPGSINILPVQIVQVEPYAVSDCDTNLCHVVLFLVTLLCSSQTSGWTWQEYHVAAIADGSQLNPWQILPNDLHDGYSLDCPADNGNSGQASCIINEMHKVIDLIGTEYYYYCCTEQCNHCQQSKASKGS